MGCFRIDLTSPLELLFYGLSLLQAYRAFLLAGRIRRDWTAVRQPPLTRQKMHLAEQAAFFLAIPPSVVVHEYFHAIPIWLFDGRIVSCGYGFYWGYVQPDRFFPAVQQWIISLGGTVGSLLFAAVLFWFLSRNGSRTLRYFGRQSLRVLLYYSLVYYPIFTALTFIGDWRVIYDFGATPILSSATAVIHIGVLLLFWQGDRRGWFEMVGHPSEAEAEKFAQLTEQWRLNPHDSRLALSYAEGLRVGGAKQKAARVLAQIIKQDPNAAGAYLKLALIQAEGKRNMPRTAVRQIETAVRLGLSSAHEQALAHQLLGQYQLDIGKGQAALQHLDQAVGVIEAEPETRTNPLFLARLYHLRSLAHQRLRQLDQARADAGKAVEMAQASANAQVIAHYQRELEIIENQPRI